MMTTPAYPDTGPPEDPFEDLLDDEGNNSTSPENVKKLTLNGEKLLKTKQELYVKMIARERDKVKLVLLGFFKSRGKQQSALKELGDCVDPKVLSSTTASSPADKIKINLLERMRANCDYISGKQISS